MRTRTIVVLLVLCGVALASKRPQFNGDYTERTREINVAFVMMPEGRVQAVLPVKFGVDQESGPITDERTHMLCSMADRIHKISDAQTVTEPVLHCGERTFVITGVQFSPNPTAPLETNQTIRIKPAN